MSPDPGTRQERASVFSRRDARSDGKRDLGPFRDVPYMGVIYVVAEAMKLGYHSDHPDWCNLGQGMPEVGVLPGAPPRAAKIEIDVSDLAYGPVPGIQELREKVAALYNRWYRFDKASKYTADNVAITAGGRLALTRAIWALDGIRLGYFTPDYTAYEDLIGGIPRIDPVHIPLAPESGFAIAPDDLAARVDEHALQALLISNPCNPTGRVIRDSELQEWVTIARNQRTALLLDEFYSHFVWNGSAPVSAARYVEDVDRDPVLVVDGLTKSYRYPGWRCGWSLGPRHWIETLTCSGSALDGGASRWQQKGALPLLEPEHAEREAQAMRDTFQPKRDLMVKRLREMGVVFPREPEGTFYCWGSLEQLPQPFDDGFEFFRKALDVGVITVPGEFFDVNPGKHRAGPSRLKQWMRFSFGAPKDVVERGLDRLAALVHS
jgi:aspartate/methionine/tyrosine aminotransferase